MNPSFLPEDLKLQYQYAVDKARENRPAFLEWIQYNIAEAIELINKVDKVYLLGYFGARLIESSPTMFNQLLEEYTGDDVDDDERIKENDEIEVLLEYLLSITTATANIAKGIIPTEEQAEEIYKKLASIKSSISFLELSAETPKDGNESDQWIRMSIMQDSMHVRGFGYHTHIHEIYTEIFTSHAGFLEQAYGFNAEELYNAIQKLDSLVYSKVGNPFGATQSHQRLTEWMETTGESEVMRVMMETGKHFIRQFTEANPDLYSEDSPEFVTSQSLENIEGYNKLFWVIPKLEKEEKIFNILSQDLAVIPLFLNLRSLKHFLLTNHS